MKHFLSLILALSLFAVPSICSAQVASGPSIALPPAEVILNACKEMGIEAVDGEYVISKTADLINKTGKVFVIDARPGRTYDDGFIPTAFNMYDAKFKLIYPEFAKLNLPKDTEIFIGIGRPCPMSLGDIKLLKEKGYTNLKAFVKGPVFFERYFSEVTAKGAKKHVSNGAVVVNLADDADLSKFFAANTGKDKIVVLAGSADNAKTNYGLADKVYKAGYKSTAVFNGNIKDIQ
jgi:rhodanese-related sulfurtransferase